MGFRPLVFSLANRARLKGWVANTSTGVFIVVNTNKFYAQLFLDEILLKAPKEAKLTSFNIEKIEYKEYLNFSIDESFEAEDGSLFFPPDLAMCKNCEKELKDKNNRRNNYAFITCTKCGPRFSILNKLPYDRDKTTMEVFEMCDICNFEYSSIKDTRFYSQTNSCHTCGIKMKVYDKNKELNIKEEKIIEFISHNIIQGKIFAIKGIGGYLLMADASNPESIKKLRKRKQRKRKPFAIICQNDKCINEIAEASIEELKSINSKEAEIVLLSIKDNIRERIAFDEIAPGLSKIGVMKAYAPILRLIIDKVGRPLIASSANITGSPIVFEDYVAEERLKHIADYIVKNNREIVIPQDDSVIQYSDNSRKIFLRRSRGHAPNFFSGKIDLKQNIFASGALMKSSFAFCNNSQIYISQYLGNTDYLESQKAYISTYKHIKSVLKTKLDKVICDIHPEYFSSKFSEELARKHNLDLLKIQHHEAHFASVIGENELYEENVIGFIWDGTGYGTDKNIWGGEIFELNDGDIKRRAHLEYTKNLLGDKMSKEARISALSHFGTIKETNEIIREKFSELEWKLYLKKAEEAELLSSSMGRLFDAISSVLGICDINDYEGEAAILLETKANEYKGDTSNLKPYEFNLYDGIISLNKMKKSIIKDLASGLSTSEIAMKFHVSLVKLIEYVSNELKIDKLAFSGGVFQNSLLITLIEKHLKHKKLYFHQQLSANDENISHGQIIRYFMKFRNESTNKNKVFKELNVEQN